MISSSAVAGPCRSLCRSARDRKKTSHSLPRVLRCIGHFPKAMLSSIQRDKIESLYIYKFSDDTFLILPLLQQKISCIQPVDEKAPASILQHLFRAAKYKLITNLG